MSKPGQRDLVVFARELREAGMGELFDEAMRTSNTRPLVDELARRVSRYFPEGYSVAVVADLSSAPSSVRQEGIAIRVLHPTAFELPLAFSTPITRRDLGLT